MKTVQEWYDLIMAEKANYTDLDAADSTSATSLFRLTAYVVAYCAWVLEGLFELFKTEVDEKLKTVSHNSQWYQQQALLYQYGDALSWNDNKFSYAIEDVAKQIIARAAVIETSGRITFKVVKDVGGVLTPLSTEELAGFLAYISEIKDAGVRISVLSLAADELYLDYRIQYDPLLLNSSGQLLSDTAQTPVQDAIDNYIATLDFNGRFSISKLNDAIQAAVGVVDFEALSVQSRIGAEAFADITVSTVAQSGYMTLSGTSSIVYYV